MSTIVLNSLNYVGTGPLNGLSYFWEKAVGILNAFSPLSVGINFGKTNATVKWLLKVPVVKTDDTACGCAGEVVRTTYVNITMDLPRSATAAERADILARVRSLVASTQFGSSVSNLELPT